ncbi:hypothetical protein K438DRAFT_1760370 [Mycena galopus ATCC 62051]|nr:hypothetical protein K438DRAFT_1760370 [Mycena galopus ATCC 62051]
MFFGTRYRSLAELLDSLPNPGFRASGMHRSQRNRHMHAPQSQSRGNSSRYRLHELRDPPPPPKSLVLNPDNDCVSNTITGCFPDVLNDPNAVATEHFSNDADIGDLQTVILSINCEADPGFVNGLLAGFQS